MKRSIITVQWLALTALLAALAASAWLALAPSNADAQDITDASASLTVNAIGADDQLRTLAVDFHPGDVGVAALQGHVKYDASKITVISCSVSEVGACHDVGGKVNVTAFNLGGLNANEQLLTVDFIPADGVVGSTSFELVIELLGNRQTQEIEPFVVEPLVVELRVEERGSLTGDVLEPGTAVGLYGIDVCAANSTTEAITCTTTTGLGTWRLDDLPAGDYSISLVDPSGTYEAASLAATVTDGGITAGLSAVLTVATEDTSSSDQPDDAPVVVADTSDEPPQTPPSTIEAIEIAYGASIQGSIQDIATGLPLQAIKVCATQPQVGHRSCGTTDGAGNYSIQGLSAGNYWITAVDPLSQYDDSTQKLVGVRTDDTVLTGVRVQLAAR